MKKDHFNLNTMLITAVGVMVWWMLTSMSNKMDAAQVALAAQDARLVSVEKQIAAAVTQEHFDYTMKSLHEASGIDFDGFQDRGGTRMEKHLDNPPVRN
jgi:hypothetical protein